MRTLVICMILMLALAASAFAQAELKSELAFSAGWVKASGFGDSASTTFLVGQYGKFLQPNLELNVQLAYASVDVGASGHLWAIAPSVAYYFNQDPTATWVPYVGAGIYYASVSGGGDSESNTNFEYYVGVKNFFGKSMEEADRALFIEYLGLSKVGKEINISTILVGISNYF